MIIYFIGYSFCRIEQLESNFACPLQRIWNGGSLVLSTVYQKPGDSTIYDIKTQKMPFLQ